VTTRNTIFCDATLLVCLAYSSAPKKEALLSPEASVNTGLHGVTPQNMEILSPLCESQIQRRSVSIIR
jgi:hypothetical protein